MEISLCRGNVKVWDCGLALLSGVGNILSCVGVKACRPTARSGRGHSARFANFANLANLFGREFLRCAGIFSVNAHCPCVRLYLCAPRGVACETFFYRAYFLRYCKPREIRRGVALDIAFNIPTGDALGGVSGLRFANPGGGKPPAERFFNARFF